MLIAVEGMDGVGKTTTGKLLAQRLGFTFIEKSMHLLFDEENNFDNYIKLRDIINNHPDEVIRAWFYGLNNIICGNKAKMENVVTDRHFLSNYFWCGSKNSEPIFECLIELIGKPALTVLLYAEIKTVKDRIFNRNNRDKDIFKADMAPMAVEKMESFLVRYHMPHIKIDTTHLTVEQVVDIIEAEVKKLI